ncbi:hypothetical protein ARALYDRAFT_895147 [Arabidopsis lyrata subsp. lyrata]|uniref:Uncharacterized protein n=1 Tax=Arabidopsis lyrata subsp. lyrata TaxID=81972 RepID=D7KR52_ARALL|nr:hypothetical protein ARALYDRAFT_895147 [Arabidopsis lyrata subsp. lyrata]
MLLIRLRSLALSSSSSFRFAHRPLSSISPIKLPNFRAFFGTAMTDTKDAGKDAVQRRLMFEDECILVYRSPMTEVIELSYSWGIKN